MVILKELITPLVPEAWRHQSDNGRFKMTLRQLYYKVKELFRKAYPGVAFYKYPSFTQDFIVEYEQVHGPIQGMLRGLHGLMAVRSILGAEEKPVKGGMEVSFGVGNKVLAVEKEDLFNLLNANRFPERLDCNVIWLQGFSTVQARKILREARELGYEVMVVHDYDINGLLIKRSITTRSKRRDITVPDVIDLGFTWEDVQELGLEPEPYDKLSKQDGRKLSGLKDRGEITQEEYEFLRHGRVELQQLSSAEILEFLEAKFEELGFWKVLPDQDELKQKEKTVLQDELTTFPLDQGIGLSKEAMEAIGLGGILKAIDQVQGLFMRFVRDKTWDLMDQELDGQTAITVAQLEQKLRTREQSYWSWVAEDMARSRVREVREALKEMVNQEKDGWLQVAQAAEEVQEAVERFHEVLRGFLS